jgi:hypothetical protein
MAASRAELEVSLFDDPTFDDKVLRFAVDPTIMVAYVTQSQTQIEPTDNAADGEKGDFSHGTTLCC